MTIGERIKNRRTELGYSVDELAQKLGKNRATVYRYEKGDIVDMPTQVLELIAKALDTTPAELMGWNEDVERFKKTAAIVNQHHASNEYGKSVAIPVVRRVAAGTPLTAFDDVLGYEAIPESLATRGTYFALRISGDSMSPGICDGDIVICREQPEAEEGQIVVALVNGNDGVCKRLRRYDNNTIALMSDNPAYQPMYFSATEIDSIPVQIKGVVVELRRKF